MLEKTGLKDREFLRSLVRLGLPIAFQNLLVSSLSVVDTVMVGRLGEVDISAVGMASQLAMLINMFMFGITSGASVFFSQYWGAGNVRMIRRAFGFAMTLSLTVATVFFVLVYAFPATAMSVYTNDADVIRHGAEYLSIAAFSYIPGALNILFGSLLRSTEKPALPMVASAFSVVVNAFLNYALIFGKFGLPEMGVRGAAIATVVSSVLSVVITVVVSLITKNILISPLKEIFCFEKRFSANYLRIAMPVFINEVVWSLGVTGYNMVFGRLGTANYSALTITMTIQNLFFVFFIGLCTCCQVLVGKSVGAGLIEKAKQTARRFMYLTPMLGIITGLLMILVRKPLVSLFSITPQAATTAGLLLLIYGIESSTRYIPYIGVVGIFRAGGDTKHGMFIDLFSLWCIGLPLTAIAALVFKLDFVVCVIIMVASEDIIKLILTIGWFRKYKWIMPVDTFAGSET